MSLIHKRLGLNLDKVAKPTFVKDALSQCSTDITKFMDVVCPVRKGTGCRGNDIDAFQSLPDGDLKNTMAALLAEQQSGGIPDGLSDDDAIAIADNLKSCTSESQRMRIIDELSALADTPADTPADSPSDTPVDTPADTPADTPSNT